VLASNGGPSGDADAGEAGPGDAEPDAQPDALQATKPAVVLFGGYAAAGAALDDTWAWDGANWTEIVPHGSREPGSAPGMRWGAWHAVLGGKLFAFGGSPATSAYLDDTWSFDGAAWSPVATTGSIPSPRIYAAAGTIGGAALLVGGDGSGVPWSTDMWSLDGAWKQIPSTVPGVPANNGGYGLPFQVGASIGGRFVLFGGTATSGAVGDTWSFDGTTWTKLAAQGPSGRYGATVSTLGDGGGGSGSGGRIVLFGGSSDWLGMQTLGDTWIFDGTSWIQFGGIGPRPRTDAAAAELDGQVLLFGGLDGSGNPLDDTWTFDGTAWTRQDVPSPPARGAAIVGSLPNVSF
jgi:N-acetylneuraminic acid mutarotase